MKSPKKVMSLDYGTKNIGIAIGNTLTQTAQPLLIMQNKDYTAHLIPLILKEEIDIVVIGIPCYADGNPHSMTEQAHNFSRYLQKQVKKHPLRKIDFYLIDERYSSVEAESRLQNNKNCNTKNNQKKPIDAWAAVILIEQFFNENNLS